MLCGVAGLIVTIPLIVWLQSTGLRMGRSASAEVARRGRSVRIAALLAGMVVLLYFVGYEAPPEHTSSADYATVRDTTLAVAGMAFRPLGRDHFPAAGWTMASLVALAALAACVAWRRHPEHRQRSEGLLAFLCGVALLAGAMGWGRAPDGVESGFAPATPR